MPVIRSGCFLICTRCLIHSLAVIEATVLLVAVGKVAVLEVDNVKVAFTSVAVVIVTASEVVDVIEVLLAAYQLVLWGGEDLREQSSEFCSGGLPVVD